MSNSLDRSIFIYTHAMPSRSRRSLFFCPRNAPFAAPPRVVRPAGLVLGCLLGVALLLAGTSAWSDDAENVENAERPTLAAHQRWVTGAAWTPDSMLLATTGGESLLFRPGDVMLWDAEHGTRMASLAGHETTVWAVAISPSGDTLATGGYDGKIIVWDIGDRADPRQRASLDEHEMWVRTLAFSHDGKLLASGSEDGTVIVWDVAKIADDAQDAKVETLEGHEATVYAVAFAPDNADLLASAGGDGTVRLWNVGKIDEETAPGGDDRRGEEKGDREESGDHENGEGEERQEGEDAADDEVAEEVDESEAAKEAADEEGEEAEDAEGAKERADDRSREIAKLEGHSEPVWAVAFSPDGKRLASGGGDWLIKVWNIKGEEKTEQMTLAGHGDVVSSLAFSPDGKTLASGSYDRTVRFWDLKAAEPTGSKSADAMQAMREGYATLNIVKAEAAVAARDVAEAKAKVEESGEEEQNEEQEDEEQKEDEEEEEEEMDAASKALAEAEAVAKEAREKLEQAERDLAQAIEKNKAIDEKIAVVLPCENTVWCVVFSPDGKRLAIGCQSNGRSVRVWDAKTKEDLFASP